VKILPRPFVSVSVASDWRDIHPVLQRIYTSRAVSHPAEVEYALKHLLPPHSLKNIQAAVALLFQALSEKWRILVVGDFDADGATSSALAVKALRAFGATHCDYLVPNRFTYGYGLTPEIVEVARSKQPDLIVTVDNGISSFEGVRAARQQGIKVLITDHHIAPALLPEADAIVNPNQAGDDFPSKNLAGVGVIFYILLSLRRHLLDLNWFTDRGLKEPNMTDYLDLVALGTVADVVPLDRNNRILVSEGLRRIRAGKACPGVNALLAVAKRPLHTLSATDLGFSVGPRLNAAGRLEDMSIGIECLLTEDPVRATQLAQSLDALNHERRDIETGMSEQAFKILEKLELKKIPVALCLFEAGWHQGVIGILASRIKDKYHRPVIAFACSSDIEIKGSARSIQGVHMRDVLDAIATRYPGLLSKFGGHAMAAGLTLKRIDLVQFEKVFIEEVALHVNYDQLEGKIVSDGVLEAPDLHLNFAQLLQKAGPWGQSFPEPLFDGVFTVLEQRLVGQKHLKMILQQGARQVDAIAFNVDLKQWPNYRCQTIHLAYRLGVNVFRDVSSLQLLVEHLEAVAV
jgi:single-stranded-DNA-specific exonuclease